MEQRRARDFPWVSAIGAGGCAVSWIVLIVLESMHLAEPTLAVPHARILQAMICLLVAFLTSSVSLITAWCPIILGGDRRPWYWIVPLVLGWLLFARVFDWQSLMPSRV